jgi:hypothetical protein
MVSYIGSSCVEGGPGGVKDFSDNLSKNLPILDDLFFFDLSSGATATDTAASSGISTGSPMGVSVPT